MDDAAVTTDQAQPNSENISGVISVEYDPEDLNSDFEDKDISYISLEGDAIIFEGSGATVIGTVVTITSAGTYSISGSLNDGQIIVDTQDAESVVLVLNGMDITSAASAPLYIRNAEKTVISLADGTENYVTDGAAYIFENAEIDEPNAAVFSKDDLTINGDGSLIVTANYNNGIAGKDDLKITGGNITVNAVNDGIKGWDSIAVKAGTITVNAGGDGMQSNNAEDTEKGYIAIEGGTFNITAGLDGIQAETGVSINDGDFTINSGGGSINTTHTAAEANMGPGNRQQNTATEEGAAISMKGIKAGTNLSISGGIFKIDAADDALHSNNILTIDGGSFLLKSGDDGIHAEYALTVNDGEVNVQQAFEGFESAVITINDGDVHLVTSDDGLNATTGAGGEQVDGSYFYINGGYVLIDAFGDGLDSNGTAIISGGVVIVHGAPSQGQGPLDVNGDIEINSGILIAAGNSFMPEVPSMNSTQNSIAIMLDSVQVGGTIVHVESENGQEILTYASPKEFQLFVFSSPELQANTTYSVYIGGDSTGTVTDGLYTDGTYTSGTLVTSFEISSNVTTVGSFDQGFGGGKGPRGGN